MATGVPGTKLTPITDPDFDTVTIGPTPSSSCLHMSFNGDYAIYSDNAGAGGNNTRLWVSAPNDGEVLIGPRGGSDFLGQVRIKHDKVSGVAGVVLRQDSTGILYLTSSSRRYKRQITDHSIDLDALRKLRVVRFKDRTQIEDRAKQIAAEARGPNSAASEADVEQATDEGEWYVGVIAEEVDDLGLSELVTYEDDPDRPGQRRPGGFRYELVALGALQIIAEQEERMRTLEERLEALEARMPGVAPPTKGR
jgi:hypothetical protein